MAKSNLGGKGLLHLTRYSPSRTAKDMSSNRDQRQELKQKGVCWLAVSRVGSACFLIHPRTTCSGVAPPIVV